MDVVSVPVDDGVWIDAIEEADALVVVAPHQSFSPDQRSAVDCLVERGGRLVLLGDPSRYAIESRTRRT